ncbi:hypothetical protein DS901_15440 [Loktanella sp. D2R18]|nr:hypothetical protein DS901_15440 [Loktanella sp. D2R18]
MSYQLFSGAIRLWLLCETVVALAASVGSGTDGTDSAHVVTEYIELADIQSHAETLTDMYVDPDGTLLVGRTCKRRPSSTQVSPQWIFWPPK